MTFGAFLIGHKPATANLIIQVGDEIAKDNTQMIADMISQNPAWKVIFPYVVPDTEKGWGDKGFNVKRIDIDYGEWSRLNANRKDPSLIGLGRTSRAVIGKHPDGFLFIDDMDDENTTSSDAERTKTRKILTGTIFPTIVPNETLLVDIGTPWTTNDTISYLKSTKEFDHIKTPVIVNGIETWPEKFDHDEIERQRNLAGELEFARMFLLDLEAAKGIDLKEEWLHHYPYEQIDQSWPVVMGVDYASTADKLKDKSRDYFALAIGRLIPGGGVVLVDGFRGHLSQGEAVGKVEQTALNYPTTNLITVEKEGVGNQFLELLRTQTALNIHGATTADQISPGNPSARNKGDRFQKQMAPHFQFSRVWLSNEDRDFLKVFKDEWMSWPRGEHDDTLDATYYMIYAAILMGGLPQIVSSRTNEMRAWYEPKKQNKVVWNLKG